MDTIKPPRISAKVWRLKAEQLTRENENLIAHVIPHHIKFSTDTKHDNDILRARVAQLEEENERLKRKRK